MGPTEGSNGPAAPLPPEPRPKLPADIDIEPFTATLPLSRGAPERRLQRTDRYDRRAELLSYEALTPTGTVSLTFRVIDDQPFVFNPGNFIGIRAEVAGWGLRKSPYCISSPPSDDRTFRLIVRLVPDGPLSIYLAGLRVGSVIKFRGPSGRSMMPKEEYEELILLATGVGVGPFLSFLPVLLADGFDRPVKLYWGLRLVDDICVLSDLDAIAARHPNFSYELTLSQPPPDWSGLRGRITESVPPLIDKLGGKRFYLVGNGAMIEEMSTVISDLGVDKYDIYEECYFNVKYRADLETLDDIRRRFVAHDLFSPYEHQQAKLYLPENPVSAN